jgi:hypothetical protein
MGATGPQGPQGIQGPAGPQDTSELAKQITPKTYQSLAFLNTPRTSDDVRFFGIDPIAAAASGLPGQYWLICETTTEGNWVVQWALPHWNYDDGGNGSGSIWARRYDGGNNWWLVWERINRAPQGAQGAQGEWDDWTRMAGHRTETEFMEGVVQETILDANEGIYARRDTLTDYSATEMLEVIETPDGTTKRILIAFAEGKIVQTVTVE